MIDYLLQTGLSNAVFSLLVAAIALAIGFVTRRPQLTYLLWLLVLIKLLTPPMVSIPVTDASWLAAFHQPAQVRQVTGTDEELAMRGTEQLADYSAPSQAGISDPRSVGLTASTVATAKIWLLMVLALGTLLAFAWSVFQILRFNRRLAETATTAPRSMQAAAADIAERLGLRRAPTVYVTAARLSPMVWWLRGRVAVIIPALLLEELDFRQWQWILAHELAHVRRRDYLVRWLEWLACIGCWWNPIVWLAQRNLRAAEEICCDSLVLSTLNPQPHSYAKSLLAVVEFLAYPVVRPPAMASEINSGGFFLRRCRMIVSNNLNRRISRWLQALVIMCAVVVLPLGAHIYAKDSATNEKAKAEVAKSEAQQAKAEKQSPAEYLKSAWGDLQAKVEAGELTDAEAKAKYEELEMALKLSACEGECAKAQFKAAQAKLDAEVAAGNISAKEAEARLADTTQQMKEQQAAQREQYLELVKAWDRQETLIGEGMATFEEAVREYMQAKQKVLNGDGIYTSGRQTYEEAVTEFQKAIKAGTMSNAEAFARLSKVEMAAYANEFAKVAQMFNLEALKASLDAAVTRGEVSEEEAERRIQAYQAELTAKDEFAKQAQEQAASEEEQMQKQQELEQKKKAQARKDAKEE